MEKFVRPAFTLDRDGFVSHRPFTSHMRDAVKFKITNFGQPEFPKYSDYDGNELVPSWGVNEGHYYEDERFDKHNVVAVVRVPVYSHLQAIKHSNFYNVPIDEAEGLKWITYHLSYPKETS